MLIYEIKLLLTSYKKILSGTSFLALFCVLMILLVASLPSRQLFAPFTIGVVDNDNSTEVTMLLEMLKNHESLNHLVGFERMPQDIAAERLDSDEIPAYIIVPPGFTQGVIIGENPPLTLVGNESRFIQLSVAKLLINAGVAFVTTSQAGIYSTLDYAYEQGMDWSEVINSLVIPINIEYMKTLLDYEALFTKTELSATDNIPSAEYFLNSMLIFLMYLFLITITGTAASSSAPSVMSRWRMCGTPLIKVMVIKWTAIWVLLSFFLIPLLPLYGVKLVAVAAMLSGLGLMSAQLFKNEQAAGLFLFTFAVVTLFISGGSLPLAFLPKIFGKLCLLTPNYWFIRLGVGGWIPVVVFCIYGALFFAIAFIGAKARCAE